MAITALGAPELALVTNDKPVLVGSNAVSSASIKHWVRSGDITGTPTNYDVAASPISRVYDGHSHLTSKPSTGNALQYLSFDLGADVDDWDMIMIGGHNFGTLALSSCYVQAGADATFGSLSTIHDFHTGGGTMSSDKRLVAFLANRYSGEHARYIRLNLQKSGGSVIPQVGEFWLGRRRHLPYKFNVAGQNKRTRSEVQMFESRSGITTRYILSQGRAVREGSIEMDGSTHIDDVTEWWKETSYGSKPFLWIEDPSTSPQDCHVMTCEPELSFDSTGPSSRMLDLAMVESAPYLSGET